MRKNWKTLMMASVLATAMAGGSTLYAQTTTSKPKSDSGMIPQGQRGDSMNMMAQMNEMMTRCNEMMRGMDADHSEQRSAAQPQAQSPFPRSYGPTD